MQYVICAIVKNEQRFIREWVEHYLSIGFTKIYVFEDFGSRSHLSQVSDYVDSGQVVLDSLDQSHFIKKERKGTMVQRNLYDKFLKTCRENNTADWIGFFDVDEFLAFEQGWDLQRLTEEFSSEAGILLSWVVYGASGHIKRPAGSVCESYTQHMPEGFLLDGGWPWNVKSLVNVHKCPGMKHIHVFKDCVNTSHKTEGLSFSCAWLNHYYTKSWEDYCERMFRRGNMHNNFRSFDQFFKCSPELQHRQREMVESVRYRHCKSTMWISRSMKIISGGNELRLKELSSRIRRFTSLPTTRII